MASDMTISKVGESRSFETQHGKFISYKLELEGHGPAELVQKPETPAPQVGQSVFGELVPGREGFPPKLKKAQKQSTGWGPKQDNPDQRRSIERQVAAKIAGDILAPHFDPAKAKSFGEQFRWVTDQIHAAIEGAT